MADDLIDPTLRYAIVSGAYSPALRRLIRQQVANQEAEQRLALVCPPDALDDLLAIIDCEHASAVAQAAETPWPAPTRAAILDRHARRIAAGEPPLPQPLKEPDMATADITIRRPADPPRFALLRRNRATAVRVREIMGLPDDNWSGISISFGMDEVPVVTIDFIPTAEQVVALAALAADPGIAMTPVTPPTPAEDAIDRMAADPGPLPGGSVAAPDPRWGLEGVTALVDKLGGRVAPDAPPPEPVL